MQIDSALQTDLFGVAAVGHDSFGQMLQVFGRPADFVRIQAAKNLRQLAALGSFVAVEQLLTQGRQRQLGAPPVGAAFRTVQVLAAYQAVHGLAGGRIAYAEKSRHIADVAPAAEIQEFENLQLRQRELLAGDFAEQLLLHHPAQGGYENVGAAEQFIDQVFRLVAFHAIPFRSLKKAPWYRTDGQRR